jgi:bla regulator protein blaR1
MSPGLLNLMQTLEAAAGNLPALRDWLVSLAAPVLAATLGAAILAVAIWLLARSPWAPRPRVLALLWWLVAAKALVTLFWALPLPVLPWAPQFRTAGSAAPADRTQVTVPLRQPGMPLRALLPAAEEHPARVAPPGEAAAAVQPAVRLARPGAVVATLVALWLAGAALALVRMLAAVRWFVGLRGRAVTVEDPALTALTTNLCRTLGVPVVPRLATSHEVSSPLVFGLSRPAVILPAVTPADDIELAIAHELLHVRHRDLLWNLVPAIAERVFFFHPLVRFAAREYALAIETCRDREVLSLLGLAPQRYGRVLLRWGIAPRPAAAGATAASPTFRHLQRRLLMLNQRTLSWSATGVAALVCLLVLAVPLQPVAAWVGPSEDQRLETGETGLVSQPNAPRTAPASATERQSARAGRAAWAVPTPPTAPTAPSPPAPATAPVSPVEPMWLGPAPLPPAPPAPPAPLAEESLPMPPVPPTPPSPTSVPTPATPALPPAGIGYPPLPPPPPIAPMPPVPSAMVPPVPPVPPMPPLPWIVSGSPLRSLVLLSDDFQFAIGNGWFDGPTARLRALGSDVLWFRYDGAAYEVRDTHTLAQVRALLDSPLANERASAALAAQQASSSGELARLAAEEARLLADAARQRSAAAHRSLTDEQAALSRAREALRAEQAALREHQGSLAEQRDGLRQAVEAEAAKRRAQLLQLLEHAIDSGLAETSH